MLNLTDSKNYHTPMCDVLTMAPVEVLCTSQASALGTTEDMGTLEDIFGINN
ncbi:MAG: hypothetical protein IKL91_01905 [Bacteroidales bacterium]|nr:hypothetical protein [Bacteroidales bacterium]